MAEKNNKTRDESILELAAEGAEALAAKVLDLQGEVAKLTKAKTDAADTDAASSKLRAEKDELKRIVRTQAQELKAAGILSPSASPIVKVGERHARVRGSAIIGGKKYTAEEIAASPELLQDLVNKKSGLLIFSDDVAKAANEKKKRTRETEETK